MVQFHVRPQMFKPFSDNIIFFDTEFSSNDPKSGEILSMGFVKVTGEELYLELSFQGDVSEFVKKNVLPSLTGKKVSKEAAAREIKEFAGPNKPLLVTFVNQFDYVYLCKIIPYQELSFDSIPIDFASILFALGTDPHEFRPKHRKVFLERIGLDDSNHREHHALDDAKMLRKVYLKMIENVELSERRNR